MWKFVRNCQEFVRANRNVNLNLIVTHHAIDHCPRKPVLLCGPRAAAGATARVRVRDAVDELLWGEHRQLPSGTEDCTEREKVCVCVCGCVCVCVSVCLRVSMRACARVVTYRLYVDAPGLLVLFAVVLKVIPG